MVHYLIHFSVKMNDLEINVIDKDCDIQLSNHFKSYEIDSSIFYPSKLEMKALTNNMI